MLSALTDTLKRSWLLTRITLRIVFLHDRELLLFPLVNWLLVVGSFVTASFVVSTRGSSATIEVAMNPGLMSAVILLLLLTVALFGMCITYTTKVRLEGGDATLGQSLGFGFRHLHLALAWMLCRLAASVFVGSIRGSARKLGFVGRLVLRPVAWLLETAWNIARLLVIPAIVYEGHGPIDALKASVDAVKRTWGEALTRHLGFGALSGALYSIGVLATVAVIWLLPDGSTVQTVGLMVAIGYFTGVIVTFHLVDTVFNAALYHYATRGEAGMGFSEEILEGSVRRVSADG